MSQTKTKTQKIIKVGNSYAITLDKKFIDATRMQVNEPMAVQYSVNPVMAQISPVKQESAKSKNSSKDQQRLVLEKEVPSEFREWVDKSLEEDKDILKALA